MAIIAEEANPFHLRELYLDGCEKISDNALVSLTFKTRREVNLPEINEFFNTKGEIYIHDFSSIAISNEEKINTLKEIGEGGARGLEVLSLAECRNITDTGITK